MGQPAGARGACADRRLRALRERQGQDYPHLLVVAGYNDSRVQYWEAAKWVAKLRATRTDANLLLLKTDLGAGHGGMSGRYQGLKDVALEYAFLLKVLGLV